MEKGFWHSWIKTKLSQGVTSRKSETGEELMVPYEQLSESAKDLDRNTVKTIYKAINELYGNKGGVAG